ncbi:MAG: glycosyltransferase family 1 protein [Patescibacteria group bacterium]|nr:glycosyltransferase family 1 protein [Patescibacteria group bacterium]
MKIVIDARFMGTATGIGRYVSELVFNLENIDHENNYFILINRENENKYQPKNCNFEKVIINIPWYGLKEQIEMPKILKKIKPDLVHFPHFNVPLYCKFPFIVTIHDLILTRYPSQRATTLSPIKYFIKNILYRIVISHAVKKSKKIIAVSEFTKLDIVNFFKTKAEKVFVTYEGVSHELVSNNENLDILNKLNIKKDFLLYVGNAYPHKNLEFLISAFNKFENLENYELVLVGQDDYFYKRLKQFVTDNGFKNIIFAGFVDDPNLSILYKKCSVYVFPSLCEGFGLPPLEAMTNGAVVLSSNYSCLPEILKDCAIYFDPKNETNFIEGLNKILNDANLKEDLRVNSQELLKNYSWEKMTKETVEIYQ